MENVFRIIAYLFLISFVSSCKSIVFPEFNKLDVNGNQISTNNFKGQNTLVIVGHLGCPAFMQLLGDFQSCKTLIVCEK